MSETTNGSLKRKRSSNFSETETRFLINIAIRHIEIVESKKCDQGTLKEKEAIWAKIANEFSAVTGCNLDGAALKAKYHRIKATIKRKLKENKIEAFMTGLPTVPQKNLSDSEKRLLKKIQEYNAYNVESDNLDFFSEKELTLQKQRNGFEDDDSLFKLDPEVVFVEEEDMSSDISQHPSTSASFLPNMEGNNVEGSSTSERNFYVSPETQGEAPELDDQQMRKSLKNSKHHTSKFKQKFKTDIKRLFESRTELIELQRDAFLTEKIAQRQNLKEEEEFLKEERKLKLQLLNLKIEFVKAKIELLK